MKKSVKSKIRKDFKNNEKIILRDFLALERTTLANERTLFSYLRTSLYMIIAGFAFLKLESLSNVNWIAYLSFIASSIILIMGLINFFQMKNKLHKYYEQSYLEQIEQ